MKKEKISIPQIIHCKGMYYREFAYKTFPGESRAEVLRLKKSPVMSDNDMGKFVSTYSSRQGLYVSVYSFTRLTGDNTVDYSSAVLDRIYLDFDSKETPGLAVEEALSVSEVLERNGISCHCYFSGGKGIAMYIEFDPVHITDNNKKEVLCRFFDEIVDTVKDEIGIELQTLDRQVRGDIARVSRLPNTRHSSGNFCVPVSIDDMKKGIDYIKELASTPRNDYNLLHIINDVRRRNNVIQTILKNIETRIIVECKMKEKTTEYKKENRDRFHTNNPDSNTVITDSDIEKARTTPISYYIGRDHKIVCPFHTDHNPSLSIDHKKNLWHCFGCGKGGDVIRYVELKYNISFIDAVRLIVEKEGYAQNKADKTNTETTTKKAESEVCHTHNAAQKEILNLGKQYERIKTTSINSTNIIPFCFFVCEQTKGKYHPNEVKRIAGKLFKFTP